MIFHPRPSPCSSHQVPTLPRCVQAEPSVSPLGQTLLQWSPYPGIKAAFLSVARVMNSCFSNLNPKGNKFLVGYQRSAREAELSVSYHHGAPAHASSFTFFRSQRFLGCSQPHTPCWCACVPALIPKTRDSGALKPAGSRGGGRGWEQPDPPGSPLGLGTPVVQRETTEQCLGSDL